MSVPVPSDERVKVMERLQDDECLYKICTLQPMRYEYTFELGKHLGLSAQSTFHVFPEAVQTDPVWLQDHDGAYFFGPQYLMYHELIAPLIGSVRELARRVNALAPPPNPFRPAGE